MENGKQTTLNLEDFGVEKSEDGTYKGKSKKSLKAEDLGEVGDILDGAIMKAEVFEFDGEKKVIAELNIPDLGESEEQRIRSLALNKTNFLKLLNAFGNDLKNWENKMVELRVETANFQSKQVPAIRVYVKKTKK